MGCQCRMSIYLAYAMLTYVFASTFYLLYLFVFNVGTPFKDSLTEEQQKIKKASAATRSYIFYGGIALGIALMFVFKPFKKCDDGNSQRFEF